jgi:hypothetical protein
MDAVPVTIETFKRAETEYYMAKRAALSGIGRLAHERGPKPVDEQNIIRLNRDTPYSEGVFDLTTPLTLTMPDGGGRFQSVMILNQDHFIKRMIYDPGRYVLTEDDIGTRYAYVFIRTFMDPNDPADMAAGRALQDRIGIEQAAPGTLELTGFDEDRRARLHDAILGLVPFVAKTDRMFGDEAEVDPVQHLIGTSAGWAGNRKEDAIYINGQVAANDGTTPHVLSVRDVPVDAFWSIIVYNAKGFYEAPENAISVNSVTAARDADGGFTVHFGGDPQARNYLRIMPGWSYVVRLYRPRPELISGAWTFPPAVPAK